jgi:prophage regulatory protein
MKNPTLQTLSSQAAGLAQMLTFNEVCGIYRKSRSGLYKLMAADPSFPKPVKDGDNIQARSYFVAGEIAAHQQSKLDARAA